MPAFINNVSGADNAIQGKAEQGIAVLGESKNNEGVRGVSRSAHAGVVGINKSTDPTLTPPDRVSNPDEPPQTAGGPGGWFESKFGEGVRGWSKNVHHGGVVGVNSAGGIGVFGTSDDGVGVYGTSLHNEGVHAETKSATAPAMAAHQLNPASPHPAFFARHSGDLVAARIEGSLVVTGNIDVTGVGSDIRLTNADCAEDFDIVGASTVEPGTVMVLGDEGALSESSEAYDRRVVGVISGAGDFKPAIVLDARRRPGNRQPIALMGKVFCKVDAHFGTISVGDLLTTSPTPGHAMAVGEPLRALGTIIGKALRPLSSGRGLIPILVTLR